MNKRIILGAAIFATLLVAGAIPHWLSHEKLLAGDGTSVYEVNVVTPHRVSFGDLIVPANLSPFEEAAVSARTNGLVVRRLVDIGSRVHQGQVLAEIDAPDLDRQTDQAEADVARAAAADEQAQAAISDAQAQVIHANARVKQSQAGVAASIANLRRAERAIYTQRAQVATAKSRLDLAKVTYDRWAALLKDGAVPPQDVDDRKGAYDQAIAQHNAALSTTQEAQAQLEAARAQLEASRADLNASIADESSAVQHVQAAVAGQTASLASHRSSEANHERYKAIQSFERVVAPFNGVITNRYVDVGSQVSPGVPVNGLFHISRSDELRTRIQIPEVYSSSITDNMEASIDVPQFPERHFQGRVFRRSGALDSDTRTLLVEVKVDNPSGVLIPGMYGQVHFATGTKSPLRVPASAVMMTSQGAQVATITDKDQVHYVTVALGEDLGTEMEIVSGLAPTVRILTTPSYSILEGTQVKPKLLLPPTPTPSAAPAAPPTPKT